MSDKLYLLAFYIPKEHLEPVLNKIFNAGAGQYGNYDRCAWTTEGMGRFRPLEASSPFIGEKQKDTFLSEIKVECIVSEKNIEKVKKVLLDTHPYEEPAFYILPIPS
ncbi:MAG: NGG1p interacting factor NIF3 [Candidatus Neomarinimicrobiota bacterium]